MAGTAVFQSNTLATPGAGIVVATDAVSGTLWQQVKLDVGPAGTSVPLHYAAGTGLPVQGVGTFQGLGTYQPLAGSVHVANTIPGTVQALGSVQTVGTSQALGTIQPLAGSVHLATPLPGGTIVAVGSALHGAAADTRPLLISAFGSSGTQAAVDDGDAVRLWADSNGRLQIRGTIDSLVGTVQTHGTTQALGTFQSHGTNQALGTFQPLAGSVHLAAGSVSAQGVVAHGVAAAGNPVLVGGFGSSGTQAAVDDGDLVRPWFDLNGRLQVRGTIDSMPTVTVMATNLDIRDLSSASDSVAVVGTVQTHGTSQALGTFQSHGTNQALGTFQPLAGSVHLATSLPGGTIISVGSAVHGGVADTRPHLISAFGSSGTQAAVDDGDAVRLWADLNGRLQVRGTVDSMPAVTGTVQTHGTSQVLGTVQAHGSIQALGTIQTHGTSQVLGSVQPVGTSQVLGSVQPVGTTQVLGSVQGVGTFQVLGTTQAHGTTYTKEVRSNAPTTTSVAATVGNIILLAANASRLGASVYLEDGQALYLKLGSNAGTLDYTLQIQPGGYWEVPFQYTGTISGIWKFVGGTARCTEITG